MVNNIHELLSEFLIQNEKEKPGIFTINNLVTGKRLYCESEWMFDNLYHNLKLLDKGTHPNLPLQEDYKKDRFWIQVRSVVHDEFRRKQELANIHTKECKLQPSYNQRKIRKLVLGRDFLGINDLVGCQVILFLHPEGDYDYRKRIPLGIFPSLAASESWCRQNYGPNHNTDLITRKIMVNTENSKLYLDWLVNSTDDVVRNATRGVKKKIRALRKKTR